jgi:hypothetical protein
MRYYVYVSETKVEQLYAQIPTKLRSKLATKLTIDLKLIKGEFEGRQPQESLFSKLDIVRNYLDDEGLIGTVDEPKSFFGTTMSLSWGPYSTMKDAEFVYFGGRTTESVVGLGGSLKHVIGEAGTAYTHSSSGTGFLVKALREAIGATAADRELDFGKIVIGEEGYPIDSGPGEAMSSRARADFGRESALTAVVLASGQMGGPWEPMEFVAKRLVNGVVDSVYWRQNVQDHWRQEVQAEYEELGRTKVLLGTPLYVAMAE